MYFYQARYYAQGLGRFVSPDSIVQNPLDPQAFNRYAYARNNPVRYTDPTGHSFHERLVRLVALLRLEPALEPPGRAHRQPCDGCADLPSSRRTWDAPAARVVVPQSSLAPLVWTSWG